MKFPSFPFYLGQFVKIVVLIFVSVYLWFPAAFLLGRFGVFADALMPLEVVLCSSVSFICLVWVGMLVRGMFRK